MSGPTRVTQVLASGFEEIAKRAGLRPHTGPCVEGGMTVVCVVGDRSGAVEFYNDGSQLGVTSDRAGMPNVWEFASMPEALDRIVAFLAERPRVVACDPIARDDGANGSDVTTRPLARRA